MLLFSGSDTPPFGTLDRAHKELNMLTVRKLKVLLHANRVGVVREKSVHFAPSQVNLSSEHSQSGNSILRLL